MTQQIPREIAADIGRLLRKLAEFGYRPTGSLYSAESAGNYYVDLAAGETWLRIVRDRGQYLIDTASKDHLKDAGLFRAFDDRVALEDALLAWLRPGAPG